MRRVFDNGCKECSVSEDRGTAVAMAALRQDVFAGPGLNEDEANMY